MPCQDQATYMKNYMAKRVADGNCRSCGKPREDLAFTDCSACKKKASDRMAALYKKRIKKGVCPLPGCGKPCGVTRWCDEHRNARNARERAAT